MVTCPAYVVPVHGPGDGRGPLHRHHHGHALLAARRALRTQAAEISRAANQTSQSRSVLKVKVKTLLMVKMSQCDHFTLGESINNFAAVSIIFTFPRLSNLSIQDHINVIACAVRGTNLPWLTLQIF